MQGSLDQPPLIIRSSVRFFQIGAAVCGFMLLFSVTRIIAVGWHPSLRAWGLMVIWGLFFLLSCWRMIDPDTLVVAPDGLTWKGRLVTRHWRWSEVSNFRAGVLGSVECDLAKNTMTFAWLGWLNKKTSGRHGMIGFGWEGGSKELADVLTAARVRWAESR